MTLEDLVGQRLMFGLSGPRLRTEDVRLFRETGAGGLILYRRNFESAAQLVGLITELEAALGRRLLIATDHEGGRVVMLRDAVTIFPDNLAVGASGDPLFARRQGQLEARELRRLGVDLNLAPVLDVLTEAYSPNIGIRSYGKDAMLVAKCGTARIRGMQGGGLSACAKHFPGKGHAAVDAHLSLPTIPSTWDEMRRVHLVPFVAAIEAGVHAVMTSHPLYPNLDPAPRTPATFSTRLVKGLLRDELGFTGVAVSDDLEMGAVAELCAVGEAAVKAAEAGHDLLLVCHTESAQRQARAALVDAYRARQLPLSELEASVERIASLKALRPVRFEGGPPRAEPDGAALARAMATWAATRLTPEPVGFRQRLNGRVAVIFPRFSELADRITIEPQLLDEAEYISRAFAPYGVSPEVQLVPIEPDQEDITRAGELVARADAAILFLFDAHLYPSNKQLLDRLQKTARALAVVLLRDPYDAELLAPGVLGLTAFGFRACQLEAVLARLLSGLAS
ncbi:MAG: beta-N-acetylhexosaminidase [Candidatus Rokubacteria bacterium]|nr:beta-N-acetylhexosaminidase [Candidatus Rokubacteria bacterium]